MLNNIGLIIQILANLAIIVGLYFTVKQIKSVELQIKDSRIQESARLMFDLNKDLREGIFSKLAIAIADKKNILKELGGEFDDSDIDRYLVIFELLHNIFKKHLITEYMLYDAFSYDIQKAYEHPEIQHFIKEVRKTNGDDLGLYNGFELLGKMFTKKSK